jgi:hypothetical protein
VRNIFAGDAVRKAREAMKGERKRYGYSFEPAIRFSYFVFDDVVLGGEEAPVAA